MSLTQQHAQAQQAQPGPPPPPLDTTAIDQIFTGLKSHNSQEKMRAAIDLRNHLTTTSREIPPEQFSRYNNDVNKRIFELIHSPDSSDRIGGILAIDALIDFDGGEENTTRITRFANYLRIVIPSPDVDAMRLAAATLGRLAIPGGPLTADFVEFETKRALEYLQSDRQEHRRHAAVLIIAALAANSPTLLYGYVAQILDHIWPVLRDAKLAIRLDAAGVLAACLGILQDRDAPLKDAWVTRLLDGARDGCRGSSPETVHGSLLAYRELLRTRDPALRTRLDEIHSSVIRHKDSRSSTVRHEVLRVLPLLAEYDPQIFCQKYLHRAMLWLLTLLRKEKDRAAAFTAVGDLARAVDSNMAPYLDAVLDAVRDGLAQKPRARRDTEQAIFGCVGKLAAAVGPALTKYLQRDILDMMLACPLSDHMQTTLRVLAQCIPPLSGQIHEKLLDILARCLSGSPFRPPGAPGGGVVMKPAAAREFRDQMRLRGGGGGSGGAASSSATTAATASSALVVAVAGSGLGGSGSASGDISDADILVRALRMLTYFDFAPYGLTELARLCTLRYVDHEVAEVRLAAALTTAALFQQDPVCHQKSVAAIRAVAEVLDRLLIVAVTDPVPEIRLEVLTSLGPPLNAQLSQAENVRLLFMAMHDEIFAIRQAAVQIVGRLSAYNPAYIVPALRKTLIQLLAKLEYSHVARRKEESARLLALLIKSSYGLARPYVSPIVRTLLPQASDSSASVAGSVLAALGELAEVGGEAMAPYVPDLMPLLLDTFQDLGSAFKRDAALRTLGQLASGAGYVVQPLLEYPQLLPILVAILRAEQSPAVRRETMRLLGILGALDPHRYREVERAQRAQQAPQSLPLDSTAPTDVALLMQGLKITGDEYYPTVVISTLMKILQDASLSSHHTAVIQAAMHIFKALGLRGVPFLGQLVPGLLQVMRSCAPSMREFYFQQLAVLVGVVKQHIRAYLTDVLQLVQEFFPLPQLQVTILGLLEALARALDGEFRLYVPTVLPLLLAVFEQDRSARRGPSLKVLRALVVFGPSMEEYVPLVVPHIVRLFEFAPLPLRKSAIDTIGRLARRVPLTDLAARIVHPLLRVIHGGPDTLRQSCVTALSQLLLQMGNDYTVFVPVVNRALVANRVHAPQYDQLVARLLNGEPLPAHLADPAGDAPDTEEPVVAEPAAQKLPVNQQALRQAWRASERFTRDDWHEWIRRLSVELLRESPAPALRACAALAAGYFPLARDLFNVAFVSCWTELYSQHQDELVAALQTALESPHNPPEIHQTLLNLAEFMEHVEIPLSLEIEKLGQYAQKCHAYAKALHYKELEYDNEPSPATVEALIAINNQLQQSDAAVGMLKQAQHSRQLELKEEWYEKLQRWDEALDTYLGREATIEQRIANRDVSRKSQEAALTEITLGKMRCLHALGEWEQLSQLAQSQWQRSRREVRRAVAPMAAAAAWCLGQWDRMEPYIAAMKEESPDRAFFSAILNVHDNRFDEAARHIATARDLLVTELTALASESYNRAYSIVVRVQMLAELEETITYKTLPDKSEKRAALRKTWARRLQGCQRNVDIWHRMLHIRGLVVPPKEDMEMWIKFANLCKKAGRFGLAESALNSLLDRDDSGAPAALKGPPPVVYAQLKYMWATGSRRAAHEHLLGFTAGLAAGLGLAAGGAGQLLQQAVPRELPGVPKEAVAANVKLLARCFLKQGEWQVALHDHWIRDAAGPVLSAYQLAAKFDPAWYKAWHAWAVANFDVVSYYTRREGEDEKSHKASDRADDRFEEMGQVELSENGTRAESSGQPDHSAPLSDGGPSPAGPAWLVSEHVVPALRAFFHSVSLSPASALQDTLRLLTLWFKFGGLPESAHAVHEGFQMIPLDTWLEVVPQLMARIHQPNQVVHRALHALLTELGKAHPQALVYPLNVAIKSDSVSRQVAAKTILDKMRLHSATLVEQAELVSHELIRIAVLWPELWNEALEEASRLYYTDRDYAGMIAVLEPLHEMMKKGPETTREASFQSTFGRDLNDAHEWILNYQRTKEDTHLQRAWDIYFNVFRKIHRIISTLQSLDLQFVSQKLLAAKNLELAVPGTYKAGAPVVRIAEFDPIFTVIASKQRPRRFTIRGSDGKDYTYLLKGHEDIRQDNLVMQLFGLVNTLLAHDSECFKRHLDIQRYPAIPLSPKSGLLGWVPNCDTFHVLVRDYREPREIVLNLELRMMQQRAPDLEKLTALQKLEVFIHALDNTSGQELCKVLWLKSRSSEAWLDRRTTYTRSLAVMSMVGYILGLGDRHPSNLMMDRISGKVVHIDFGDCFEAAMFRDRYPERVPFRLTRMLVYAMEVSGIEGSFRITCEHVMRVLRDNKESLMAILEAFVFDPLINWGFEIPVPNEQTKNMPDVAQMLKRGEIDQEGAVRLELQQKAELRNARAALVLKRIMNKLTGNDFASAGELDVPQQVDKLIQQATNIEKLCQHYLGWCPYW